MDLEEAKSILRIDQESITEKEVHVAFSRLSRRYPLAQFPDRHEKLLKARDLLLSPDWSFHNALFAERVDVSWLSAYRKSGADQALTTDFATLARSLFQNSKIVFGGDFLDYFDDF